MNTTTVTMDDQTAATLDTVTRFGDALNRHDIDIVMAYMTDDCLFDNTSPAPDGEAFVGQQAVRAFWVNLLTSTPDAHFATEEIFAVGDRCVVRWLYTYTDRSGAQGHIRGVDIFRVRDGKVAEKLAYVKG